MNTQEQIRVLLKWGVYLLAAILLILIVPPVCNFITTPYCEGDVGTHMMTGREICDVDRDGSFGGQDYFLD